MRFKMNKFEKLYKESITELTQSDNPSNYTWNSDIQFYYTFGMPRPENTIILFTYLYMTGFTASQVYDYLTDLETKLIDLGNQLGLEPFYPKAKPELDFNGRDYIIKWRVIEKSGFNRKLLKQLGIKESKTQNIV